jgi:hypothetical protein
VRGGIVTVAANPEPIKLIADREGKLEMQSASQVELKQRSYPKDQFDDEEYKRWSQKLQTIKSPKTDWGIASFLGRIENRRRTRETND